MSVTKVREISIGSPGKEVILGGAEPFAVICGPCVIESRDHCLRMAEAISKLAEELALQIVFKASFDKANRTSLEGFRGPGIDEGLRILSEARDVSGLPVLTDVHDEEQAKSAAEVLDAIQIPAFLCRQTSLLLAAGRAGKPVMVKKGQFLHPADMQYVAEKIESTDNRQIILCERGTCFGYRELIVDFRSFEILRSLGYPIVFDATHSVQIMGGAGGCSSGAAEFVPSLARAAVAVGVHALFLETHDSPENALSDGANMLPLAYLKPLLLGLINIGQAVRASEFDSLEVS